MEIVCFGELLLRLGAPGREFLLQSPRLDVQVGGAEANVAVSLSRLGHRARMVGVVSTGPLGEAAAGELRRHRVDTTALRTGPGRMGLYFLQTGAGLRPSEVLYDRAGSAFALADPAGYDWPALLAGADWLHLSGVTPALGQRTSDAALAAARAARKLGVKVSFDGNYRPKLWQAWQGDAPKILRELIAEADLVFADHRDMSVVLGIEFADEGPALQVQAAAREAFAAFPNLQTLASTIRTQHSVDHHALAAVMVARNGHITQAPAIDLPGIIDRIGGGDAFAAGLLHAISMQGESTTREDGSMVALRFALAAAALKHSIPGDFNLASEADIQACANEARFDVKR